jgi:uncharacterized protein
MNPETGALERLRIWAKVQRIERINPLFPSEAGQELADTQTSPLDTVLSLSREMITAVCRVLGTETLESPTGKLGHLRYPAQPATNAYSPESADITRVVLGELQKRDALDIATLANRPEIDVSVDGHKVVTRHLAILAMTGAGKSWAARRIIEQLAAKNYPIVIFDPRGDYTGLADVPSLKKRVKRFYAQFPVFEEDAETVASIVSSLAYKLTDTMRGQFPAVFNAATSFYVPDPDEMKQKREWLASRVVEPQRIQTIRPDLWLVALMAEVAEVSLRNGNTNDLRQLQDWGWDGATGYTGTDVKTLEGIKKRCRRAAAKLFRMEQTNKKVAQAADPLPTERKQLVQYGQISVVSLAGYASDFQATIYALIAEDIFAARVSDELKYQVLFVVEEAHNFAPPKANTAAEEESIRVTRQIAQEGRKFGVGLILISQRPSRLDETALSMCNSYVIMRMLNPADQAYVRKVVETIGDDEARMLPDLDIGEAIFSGQFINFPVLAKLKEPESKGEREEEDAFEQLEKVHRDMLNGQK